MENFHKAKIRNFPKWLIHDFNPKIQNFSLFVFPQNNNKGLTHDFGQKTSKKLYLIFLKIRLKKECLHVLTKKNLLGPQNGISL